MRIALLVCCLAVASHACDPGDYCMCTNKPPVCHKTQKPCSCPTPPPAPCPNKWQLYPNEALVSGERCKDRLVSATPQGIHELVMQTDGNLVLYTLNPDNTTAPVWDTDTATGLKSTAIMQTDGNFVVYQEGKAAWQTGNATVNKTHGKLAYLYMQSDCNLVMRSGPDGPAIWATGTEDPGDPTHWHCKPRLTTNQKNSTLVDIIDLGTPCVDKSRGRSDGKCCPSCAHYCPGHCGDHDCSCNAGDFYLGFSCEADKDCPGSYCMKDPSKKPPYQCH